MNCPTLCNSRRHRFRAITLAVFAVLSLLLCATESFAQNYIATLVQRRHYDQIHVEVWLKSVSASNTTRLGSSSFAIHYNSTYLTPDVAQAIGTTSTTDTINYDVDATSPATGPVIPITTQFSGANGYANETAQAYGNATDAIYSLEINHSTLGTGGVVPSSTGRGSYLGRLVFNINAVAIPVDSLTRVQWNSRTDIGDIRAFDRDSNDIESQISFVNPSSFTIIGVTLLNPNGPSEVVDRDRGAAPLTPYAGVSLTTGAIADGYPIYFERSIDPTVFTPAAADNDLGYVFEYSLDGGTSWTEFGRVAEDAVGTTPIGAGLISGEINNTAANLLSITDQGGLALGAVANLRRALRVFWQPNTAFQFRSEQARLRIRQLTAGVTANIATRTVTTIADTSDADFVLGRLFFTQLNGTSQYYRTNNSYSNSTQLTVETWINLNSMQAVGTNPGIVASSAGPVNGAEEGQWILYLKDGRYPAFRAREIEGRGTNGYIADIHAYDPLPVASDAYPLGSSHANNWVHLAATVANNIVTLYVNGEVVATETNTNAPDIRMGIDGSATNFPYWFGVDPNVSIGATDYLHAGLKGTRVWRTALTQTEIKQRVAGIPAASTAASGDVRSALDVYYTFEGTRNDAASDATFQFSADAAQFYVNSTVTNNSARFRPDLPHIRLIAPTGCEGVSNRNGVTYNIRWVGYGFGSVTLSGVPNGSKDLDIQFSTDGGTTYTYAKGTGGSTLADNLGGPDVGAGAIDLESGSATWEANNNDGTNPDPTDPNDGTVNLQTLNYSANTILRIRGDAANDQGYTATSSSFVVAPHFALQLATSTRISIPAGTGMNIGGNTALVEAWVRPYRFPTTSEAYFPIISKIDSSNHTMHYSLRILPSGRLQFVIGNNAGVTSSVTSDSTLPLARPNMLALDSTWTHVAAYFNRNSGVGNATVQFFIDGTAQTAQTIDSNLTLNTTNEFPTYIGYEPDTDTTVRSYIGEMRDLRFWNATPGGVAAGFANNLTQYIQGAATVHGANFSAAYGSSGNLVASFDLDGGSFVNSGNFRSIPSTNTSIFAYYYETQPCFAPTLPFVKFVEPVYQQQVMASNTNTAVRWIGFDYDNATAGAFTDGFSSGTAAPQAPSLEFSLYGGGNVVIQPYQTVGSNNFTTTAANTADAFVLTGFTGAQYLFPAAGVSAGGRPRYSASFVPNVADPDANNNGVYDDQTRLASTLVNARLRLSYRYYLGDGTTAITRLSESPLFTVVPNSNFTVRALLEGRHLGAASALMPALPSTYAAGGVKIKLYEDNAGTVGAFVDSAESTLGPGYSETDPTATSANTLIALNDGAGGASAATATATASTFANIPFIFTGLNNGSYWVVVEQINHLPVMSRFPATFVFTGDNYGTWAIESGWDFLTWAGVDNTVMTSANYNATLGNYLGYTGLGANYPSQDFTYTRSLFSAYGSAISTSTTAGYSTTGLIYNDGQVGGAATANSFAAMVAGDVVKDGQINAADRVRVRVDLGTNLVRSDVSGDGVVNATDVGIVDRNFGKVSSLNGVTFPASSISTPNQSAPVGGNSGQNVFDVVSQENPELSLAFNEAVKEAISAPAESGKAISSKHEKTLGQTISYVVTATPIRTGNFIDVPVYIRNTGASWNIANSTIGIGYNSNSVDFVSYDGVEKVPFSNRTDLGYDGPAKSAPAPGAVNSIPDMRTIEITFDASPLAKKAGMSVPNTNTYLGTLRFKLKSTDKPAVFTWHWNKVVYSTDREDVTPNGDFRPITPVLTYTASVTIPNGGEKWRAGRKYNVQWNGDGKANVNLEYSVDNGTTWTKFGTALSGAKTTSWTLPNITATQCLVRVLDAESGYEIDRSDNAFAISPALANITRPAQPDPVYIGGRTDNIKWSAQSLGNVKFEFSADGGKSWTGVTTTTNASNGTISWKVPAVNSKHAVVRMIEADNNEEVIRSEEFKVLAGTLKFVNPKSAEVWKAGVQNRVRWAVENNVTSFDMEFSKDGGATWMPLKLANDAVKGYWDWVVPNVPTTKGMLRAFLAGDSEMEYTRSPIFTVTGTSGVDPVSFEGFTFELPTPNPARRETELNFSLPSTEVVTITLHDATGREVATVVRDQQFTSGAHNVHFNVESLASGTYFFTLNAGNATLVQQINVVK